MSLKVNKKSVKQDGGAMIPEQPGMLQQPEVDPAVQQISEFIKQSLEDGAKPEELVMSLVQQEVDQQIIGQAFMMVGYQQEDVVTLFEQVQVLAQQKQAGANEVNQNPQQLARNQQIEQRQQGPVETESIDTEISETMIAKSGIEINPKNEGKFTRWAKARGMTVKEAYNKVMSNSKAYPPSVVKMANFAKNAAGWKKEEGGEAFTAHMMYKGQQAVKANTIEDHLRLKEDGYVHADERKKARKGGDMIYPVGAATSSNALPFAMMPQANDGLELQKKEAAAAAVAAGEAGQDTDEVDFMTQFMNNMNTTLGEQNTQGDNTIKKVNNTISQGPLYVSPNLYEKDGFSLGNAFNSVLRVGNNAFSSKDLDGDGTKDGYLRDLKPKAINAKIDKYANANYNINLDDVVTEENLNNAQVAYKKFIFENPTADDQYDAVGNLVNAGLEDNNIPKIEIPQGTEEEYKDFIEKNTDLLGDTAKATYEALRKKLGFQLGGSLAKAQFSVPDSGAPFANPMEEPAEDATETLSFQEWVMQDSVGRGGANAPQEYQAYVESIGNEEQRPEASTVPLPEPAGVISPTEWDKDGDGIPDMGIDIDMGDGTGVAGDFQSAYDKVVKPTVDVDFGGVGGFAKRAYDSSLMKGFEGVSGGIIDLTANIFNPLKNRKNALNQDKDKRSRIVADELFAIETDPFNSRGTNNIQGGPKGSEADRTTGLYLNQGVVTSKMGGGTNNAGFKALPASVQHNILSNLAYGGSTGPEAYLATGGPIAGKAGLGRLIKEGVEQLPGALRKLKTYFGNSDKANPYVSFKGFGADDIPQNGPNAFNEYMNSFAMIDPAILATMTGLPFLEMFRGNSKEEGEKLKFDNEHRKSRGMTSDGATWRNQQGGETVSVDSTMLAKLIAAGADIEML